MSDTTIKMRSWRSVGPWSEPSTGTAITPYGVWPWAQPLLNGATPEIIGTAGTTIQMEKVAATTPDLIVGTYSGLTQAQYDKLSAIAPTVAQPKEFADYGIPWQNQTTIIGEALGQQGKATELIAGVDQKFADVKTANPAFAGKTVLVGALKGAGAVRGLRTGRPEGAVLHRTRICESACHRSDHG